jgi:polar amino acid transport system substrate-binding protein
LNPRGVGTLLGEAPINTTINGFIEIIKADGTMDALYREWFGIGQPMFEAPVEGVSFTVD